MSHPIVSTPRQADFLGLPQTPLCYWLRPRFFELLAGRTLGDVADVCQGLATADDERFVRFVWEVRPEEWARPLRERRWVPFEKGGGYGKWFGHHWWAVDWEDDGARIKAFPASVVRNEQHYFREGWTYSSLARGSVGARTMRESLWGAVLADAVIAPADFAIGAILNTRLASAATRWMRTSMVLSGSYVARIPLPERIPDVLVGYEAACVVLKRWLVAHDPTERTFAEGPPMGATLIDAWRLATDESDAVAAVLHTLEALSEREVFTAYRLDEEDIQAVLDETGTPAGWFPLIAGYDALPALPPGLSVEAKLLEPLAREPRRALSPEELAELKRRLRALCEAGRGARGEDAASPLPLSRAAGEGGGGEGNESDEEEEEGVVSGARIPIPAETFLEELAQKLEVHPISVYWLLQELREQEGLVSPPLVKQAMEDYVSVTILRLLGYRWPEQDRYEQEHGPVLDPALVVEDGILPLVAWGNGPTAVERVRLRLERDFGEEGAAQSEREFRQWVGRDLDDWLRREFFKRHVQQFKQRPIAWHLVSPERTFEAFVLYHKLSRATLQKLRAQYAGGLIARLRAEQERARQRGAAAEVSRLQLQIEDVEEFRARLEQIERGDELRYRIRCRWKGEVDAGRPGPYAPDIDDGVKVNLRPFQEAGLLAVKEVIKKW